MISIKFNMPKGDLLRCFCFSHDKTVRGCWRRTYAGSSEKTEVLVITPDTTCWYAFIGLVPSQCNVTQLLDNLVTSALP